MQLLRFFLAEKAKKLTIRTTKKEPPAMQTVPSLATKF
jgi:hypothetical protein